MNESRSAFFEQSIILNGEFSPADLKLESLIDAGVVQKEKILTGSVFNADQVSIVAEDLNVALIASQLLVVLKPGDEQPSLLSLILHLIKKASTSTDMVLNFAAYVFLEGSLEHDSKKLFYKSDNKFQEKYFGSSESVFGFNGSTYVKYSRLNLDVKPIQLVHGVTGEKRNAVTVAANFFVDAKLPPLAIANMIQEDYSFFVKYFKNILEDIL